MGRICFLMSVFLLSSKTMWSIPSLFAFPPTILTGGRQLGVNRRCWSWLCYQVALDRSRSGQPHLASGRELSVLVDLPLRFSISLVSIERTRSVIKTFLSAWASVISVTFTIYFLHSCPPSFPPSCSPSLLLLPSSAPLVLPLPKYHLPITTKPGTVDM